MFITPFVLWYYCFVIICVYTKMCVKPTNWCKRENWNKLSVTYISLILNPFIYSLCASMLIQDLHF